MASFFSNTLGRLAGRKEAAHLSAPDITAQPNGAHGREYRHQVNHNGPINATNTSNSNNAVINGDPQLASVPTSAPLAQSNEVAGYNGNGHTNGHSNRGTTTNGPLNSNENRPSSYGHNNDHSNSINGSSPNNGDGIASPHPPPEDVPSNGPLARSNHAAQCNGNGHGNSLSNGGTTIDGPHTDNENRPNSNGDSAPEGSAHVNRGARQNSESTLARARRRVSQIFNHRRWSSRSQSHDQSEAKINGIPVDNTVTPRFNVVNYRQGRNLRNPNGTFGIIGWDHGNDEAPALIPARGAEFLTQAVTEALENSSIEGISVSAGSSGGPSPGPVHPSGGSTMNTALSNGTYHGTSIQQVTMIVKQHLDNVRSEDVGNSDNARNLLFHKKFQCPKSEGRSCKYSKNVSVVVSECRNRFIQHLNAISDALECLKEADDLLRQPLGKQPWDGTDFLEVHNRRDWYAKATEHIDEVMKSLANVEQNAQACQYTGMYNGPWDYKSHDYPVNSNGAKIDGKCNNP